MLKVVPVPPAWCALSMTTGDPAASSRMTCNQGPRACRCKMKRCLRAQKDSLENTISAPLLMKPHSQRNPWQQGSDSTPGSWCHTRSHSQGLLWLMLPFCTLVSSEVTYYLTLPNPWSCSGSTQAETLCSVSICPHCLWASVSQKNRKVPTP